LFFKTSQFICQYSAGFPTDFPKSDSGFPSGCPGMVIAGSLQAGRKFKISLAAQTELSGSFFDVPDSDDRP
jgi:hypothetical protein